MASPPRLRPAVVAVLTVSLGAGATAAAAALSQRLDQPISATFREVDFSAALGFLGENAGVNIVLSPKAQELGRPVTLRLVEIPLRRAVEYLVKGQGLVYRFDQGAVFVATLDEMEGEPLETRVFALSQGPGLFASFEPLSETRESVALQPVGIKRMTTIKDVLEEVIPEVGGSSVILEERSGSLIVTHVPYYLGQIEALLEQLDVPPTEVRIEARFIELTVTDTDELGLDFQLNANAPLILSVAADNTKGAGFQLAATGTDLARGTKIDFSDFTRQASGASGEGLNLTLQGVLTGTQYQSVLHAFALSKKTKTLSAPQVTTLNNQTAALKVVDEFVYASRYEASVQRKDLNSDGDFLDSGETKFVNVPQDFVTKDLGILLNVTPSVGRDLKTIVLALKPEVSEQKTTDTFSGEISLPRFTTRNLSTSVVIEDGETVVLGGLMKDTVAKTITKVPGLSRIPLLGALFQKRANSVERSNLLIFVTANVVKPSGGPTLAQEPIP